MSLPVQVQKQSQQVQDLYVQMNGTGEPNSENAESEESETPDAPIVEKEKETAEQKYRTLQGMYNADIPRLNAQIREKNSAIADLNGRVVSLEALLGTIEMPSTPKNSATKYVTDDDVKEYGETIDVMRRAAREEADAVYQPRIIALEQALAKVQNLAPRVEGVVQNQEAAAVSQFYDILERAVPDWRGINDDPGFKTWLLQTDTLTGSNKQEALAHFEKTRNVQQIIKFFDEWKRISGSGEQSNPIHQQNRGNAELERQVAPDRGRASTLNGATKKSYTRADISLFYADVAKGKYKGREQEKATLEADILASTRDGRLT
jgi:hypothetical protein